METKNIWNRVGHWFRGSRRRPGLDVHAPGTRRFGGMSQEEKMLHNASNEPTTAPPAGPMNKLRWMKPNPHLERLESEYTRVVELVDAIAKHLAAQVEHADHMSRSLERLAEGVSTLPDASRQQLDLLSAINESVAAGLTTGKQLQEGFSQLPQLADAQREAMVAIGRQLDASRAGDERLVESLQGVGESVAKLGEVTDSSSQALEAMRRDASARDDRILALVEKQAGKMAVFAWSALGLAAVGAILGLVALLR